MLRQNEDTETIGVMKMSKDATREYIKVMRKRYGAMKSKQAKGRMLDEFCATTQMERKYAIKVLRGSAEPMRRSGRKPTYGLEVAEAVRAIWMKAGQPCSKLMCPIMGCYVSSYEKGHGAFTRDIRKQLLSVSASSIDRLLRPFRVAGARRRRGPGGAAAVKQVVPVRAGLWEEDDPGWIEADTVAHCGGSMEGNFAWSLTMTDICTQWTEVRAMWNRGAAAAHERISHIETALPFDLRGFDSDNGPEFMNWHLHSYLLLRDRPIAFTRSRAYHKNDNAHVEQKNSTHVRNLLGYERIDDAECVEELNRVLCQWSLWKNLYSPVMKLISRTRVGSRYIKRYDRPRTPAQRVLEQSGVPKHKKQEIRKLLAASDCFTLKDKVDQALRRIFASLHQRQIKEIIPLEELRPSALRAAPSGTGRSSSKGRKRQSERMQPMVSSF